ncbi:MAG: hypothetical protein NC308_07770 [Clostridium sp.]|nr:hypothetical protein [Bacteroides sp.]MCM1198772.1 hypothetical protein [Clostridium sp.]
MKKIFLTALLASMTFMAFAGSREDGAGEPFDRGIGKANACFIPKGTVGCGLSVSYNNYSIGNASDDAGYKMLFSLLDGVHANLNSFGISPYVSYFFADNLSVGLRFDYEKSGFNLGNIDLALSDDLAFSVNDLNYIKQGYSGAIALRNYMPIANSRRFAIFAEVSAAGTYAQSESYRHEGENKFGTYSDIYKLSLGIVPGVVCFMTNEAALEVSVGVLGFDYQKTVQTTNQVEKSVMENSNANFKINLLSIKIGMSFYILTGKHRKNRV